MLCWVDLETTGLDPTVDGLLEVAIVMTDDDLKEVGTGHALIQYNGPPLASLTQVVLDMHTRSGLFTDCMSDKAMPLFEAEAFLLGWLLDTFGDYDGKLPMCGSSVAFDRRFLIQYMPRLEKFFHYRSIDVSSVKELVKRWLPGVALPDTPEEQKAHRAAQDIRESIKELRYYRENAFVPAVAGINHP